MIGCGCLITDDESAADAEVGPGERCSALGIVRDESHAVRMLRQRFSPMKQQVGRLIEWDLASAWQTERFGRTDPFDASRDTVDIHLFWSFALEPEQHRLVGAVSLARERERAVQMNLDSTLSRSSKPESVNRSRNCRAARIGPTVCELLGPMPMVKRSRTLI